MATKTEQQANTLATVTHWREQVANALGARDRAIRMAVERGNSLRTVAEAAGMSHQAISDICKRA